MSPHRYAVFGLLDESAAATVRPLQERIGATTGNGLALRFPVHVTLRGRFWGEPEAVTPVFQTAGQSGRAECDLLLTGPVFRPPDLLWLSVELGGSGYPELSRLHALLDASLNSVITLDETLPAHAGVGYRPHVTLAWGATEEMVGSWEPQAIRIPARLAGVVLAEYPDDWPSIGIPRVVSEWEHPDVR